MNKYVFTDKEYGKVLDNFVIGCVDVAIIYKDKILLERRKEHPIKGEWWIFGGRMLKDETFKAAAARNVQRELNIFYDETKFEEIGTYNLVWPSRREPPQSNGCHHILIAHKVIIDDNSFRGINQLIGESEIDAEWFRLNELKGGQFLDEIVDVAEKCLN